MRHKLSRTLGAMVVAVVGALIVFGLMLNDAQQSARDDIAQRFRERAVASAALTSSLFESAAGTSQVTNIRRYGGQRVSSEPLARRARESNNEYIVVVDSSGAILAASPGATPLVRRRIAAKPSYISDVLAGAPYALSDVLRSSAGKAPGLVYAQSFPGPQGRRAVVSGLDGKLIAAFLGGSLKQLPTVEGGHTYVLDSRGAIVASPERGMATGSEVSEKGLQDVLGKRGEGTFGAGRHFAADRIKGTPWSVVLTAPEAELFASVRGSHKWGPWALFVAFGLVALAAVALVGRVVRAAAKVSAVNAELGRVNDELDSRAKELVRSNEELERFASVASHDLQEPLRKVQMFSERVSHHDGAQLSDRGRDYLERMNSAARRMQALIDGLLVYARVTTEVAPHSEVDLDAVVREVVDDLHALIGETEGTVQIGSLPRVPADALQMRQLFQNLLSNGLKFHREGVPPIVRVDGTVESDTATITVSDNGVGFEQRHSQRIFNVFERLHPRGQYPGTGMGLALCRRIVEGHGGTITAESVTDMGSKFVVTLPTKAPSHLGPSLDPADANRQDPPLVRT